MTTPKPARTVDEHRAAVAALMPAARAGDLPLSRCSGRVLAAEVPAEVDLPPFDNSAMDGYAVRAVDVADATPEAPTTLPVDADVPAGRTDGPPLLSGTAHRIMTGAPMPPGADTVVRVEDTDGGVEQVQVRAAPAIGTSVRRTGEDIHRGEPALAAGTVLGPAHLGLAAAVGRSSLPVWLPLRVLVVSTGSELVTPPGPLRHGQIYESNSVLLGAAIEALGCEVDVLRSVADDVPAFRAALAQRAEGVDLIVTSGGVSAGAYEVVKDALSGDGVEFTKVAMQPGGPQGCGLFDGTPIVTLPGNPVSVAVSFEVFLRPALLAALGHSDVERPRVRATLLEPLRAPHGKRQFRRGFYRPDPGRVTGTVGPRGGPASHLLAAYSQANCLIVIDEDTTELAAGAEVDVLLL
jgi:molybdopterin molybdotransferase